MSTFEQVAPIVSQKLSLPMGLISPSLVIEDYCTDSIMFIDLLTALQHKFAPGKETIFDGSILVVTVDDLVKVVERCR